jgi:hypothetical protein
VSITGTCRHCGAHVIEINGPWRKWACMSFGCPSESLTLNQSEECKCRELDRLRAVNTNLLAACEAFLGYIGGSVDFIELAKMVRAAVAHAKGETP